MREISRDEVLAGVQAGRTLVIQRKDDPNLPMLMEMQEEGLIVSELKQLDEQSSILKFRSAEAAGEGEDARAAE